VVKKLPVSLNNGKKRWELYDDVEYDAFWKDWDKNFQDKLEKYLISKMLPTRGLRVIDVGCGHGRLFECYRDRFHTVILFDGSINLLKKALNKYGKSRDNVFFIAGDVNLLPFREASFDCVLMIRVLQHLFELENTFSEIYRVMSRAGEFVFSYHNKQNAHRILNWFLGRETDNPFSQKSKEVSPALVSHHPAYIEKGLHKAGFQRPYYLGAVYLKQIARLREKILSRGVSGSHWARFMGKLWLAPWMIGRTRPRNRPELMLGSKLTGLLVCPICRVSVQDIQGTYLCPACDRKFNIQEGILDFRPY
jgi:ubiquinone/menaquinone biosynthesis C-methylase UbiE